MAAASTAALAVALSAGSVFLGGTEWPYIVAFPLIVVAAVLEFAAHPPPARALGRVR